MVYSEREMPPGAAVDLREFTTVKPRDSQRSRQVEALFSDIKEVLDHLNSTRGVWKGTEEEAVKLDKLNASAKSLNNPKLEEAILRFRNEIYKNPVFATGIAAGMQHPYIKDIQDFFRDNGYVFIITQSSEGRGVGQTSVNQAEENRPRFWYLFGGIDGSKVRGYGDMGVKADFLKDVQTPTPFMAGFSSTFTNSSILVVRTTTHEGMLVLGKLEEGLTAMDEQQRKLVDGFDKLGVAEFQEYAKNKNPVDTRAALADITYTKTVQEYMKDVEGSRETMLRKIMNDIDSMNEAHELGEKIVSMKTYGDRSFQTETVRIGDKRVYLIRGAPLLNVSAESRFEPWEREMVSDLVSLIEKPKKTIMETMERYKELLKQDSPEEVIMVNIFKRYYEASREIVDNIVKYVEEHREQFPNVKKSGILMIGELNEEQLRDIGKKLLEKKYEEKGYVFNSSLIF